MAEATHKHGANVANRLDRLPISSLHALVLVGLAFAYFFELGDLNTLAFTSPALVKIWHFTANDVAQVTSISFLGMGIGALFGGWFADRIGRKGGLLFTVAWYSLFSLLTALAWDKLSLETFRFLTGLGLSSMVVIANTYISEFFPANVRGRYQGLVITIGLIGIPATSWFARFVIPLGTWEWRLVFIWGALGVLSLFIISKFTESPRWFEKRGDLQRADETMQFIENRISAQKGPLPLAQAGGEIEAIKKTPYRELFNKVYLRRTLILIVAWVFQTLGFYGFQSWVPTLLVLHGISVTSSLTYTSIATLGAPLGALLASFLSDRFERKWLLTITSIVIAICGLLYGATFQPFFIITFGLLISVFIQTFASFIYAYSPELYPTQARASGTGLTYGSGRLANVLGPLIISFLFLGYGYVWVFVFCSACWLVVALTIGIFGPRTKQRSLEYINAQEEDVPVPDAISPAISQS